MANVWLRVTDDVASDYQISRQARVKVPMWLFVLITWILLRAELNSMSDMCHEEESKLFSRELGKAHKQCGTRQLIRV